MKCKSKYLKNIFASLVDKSLCGIPHVPNASLNRLKSFLISEDEIEGIRIVHEKMDLKRSINE